jgi:hypothetical protein
MANLAILTVLAHSASMHQSHLDSPHLCGNHTHTERATFSDVVKVLEDGDLQTLGLLDYDKRLKHSFTAHPKVDPFTGIYNFILT